MESTTTVPSRVSGAMKPRDRVALTSVTRCGSKLLLTLTKRKSFSSTWSAYKYLVSCCCGFQTGNRWAGVVRIVAPPLVLICTNSRVWLMSRSKNMMTSLNTASPLLLTLRILSPTFNWLSRLISPVSVWTVLSAAKHPLECEACEESKNKRRDKQKGKN